MNLFRYICMLLLLENTTTLNLINLNNNLANNLGTNRYARSIINRIFKSSIFNNVDNSDIDGNNPDDKIDNKFRLIKSTNNVINNEIIFLPLLTGDATTSNLYNEFLTCLSERQVDIYIPNGRVKQIIDYKNNNNTKFTLVSHSFSAIDAINVCNNISQINKLVLIDPLEINNDNKIDNNYQYIKDIQDINKLTKKPPKLQVDVDEILLINNQRSHDWNLVPFIIPISFFNLKTKRLNLTNIHFSSCKADKFGHFDILDNKWSNIIHNTISRGNKDRSPDILKVYKTWLVNKIMGFI